MKIVQKSAHSLTVKSNGIVLGGVFLAGSIVFGGGQKMVDSLRSLQRAKKKNSERSRQRPAPA